ncbi:MAG TPA: hypothetical protein VG961_00835 [Ignavibacteria bacterium]|nr:hypothetical protein [Ignavibacteria bacterium]
MKNYLFLTLLFIMFAGAINFTFSADLSGNTGGPHDSLLFDGDNSNPGNYDGGYYPCSWKVVKLKGYAFGTVRKMHIGNMCGTPDTSYILKDDTLKEGDILSDGTIIETGAGAMISVAVFMKSDPNRIGRFFMTAHEFALMKIPLLDVICEQLKIELQGELAQKVLIIKGKVTYDSPPSEKSKLSTKGKRSSVIHNKTRYSHEVLVDAGDSIDIVRVYEGSVEISPILSDFSDYESKGKEMEQLAQDFQAGKITMEEMARKIEEFQNNTHQLSESMKPFLVEAGSKCILNGKTYIIEPLGAGDEDNAR